MRQKNSNKNADQHGKSSYAQDVDFPSEFISAQTPLLLSYVAAIRGFVPPDPVECFTYCELGCGTGTTLNNLAAANPHAGFTGIDFNSESVSKARATAKNAGLDNVEYLEIPFSDLHKEELAGFDYVTMQGTYSYLPPDIVDAVINFLDCALSPGGLFFVEFLLLPAMASAEPVTRLMRELTATYTGSSVDRANYSLEQLEAIYSNKKVQFFRFHPLATELIEHWKTVQKTNPKWAKIHAHGNLAGSWVPKYVTEVAEELGRAGLVRAGNTMLRLNDLELSLLDEHRALLDGIDDPLLVELMIDYIQQRPTRQDVFVKDSVPDPASAEKFIREKIYFLLKHPVSEYPLAVDVPDKGRVVLDGPIYKLLRSEFEDTGSRLCDFTGQGKFRKIPDSRVVIATTRIAACNSLFLCCARTVEIEGLHENDVLAIPHAYNQLLLNQHTDALESVTMASQVTGGGGIKLPALVALLLRFWVEGGSGNIAARVHEALQKNPGRIRVGKELIPAADVTWEMLSAALGVLRHRYCLNLARLGIIEAEQTTNREPSVPPHAGRPTGRMGWDR